MQAFLPGAGLGTRLRPITDHLPKPLVPLFHRPLVEHALEACRRVGAERFAVNTHHLAAAWETAFPTSGATSLRGGNGVPARRSEWRRLPVTFFHEPVLLETGGGLKNIEPWAGETRRRTVLVHNADSFTTIDLVPLVAAHRASGQPATLVLRSSGPGLHVAVDRSGASVTDIRGMLGRAGGDHQFTGVYCVEPELFGMIPPAEKVSVIPAFLQLARAGRLGCVVLDDGCWLDLGDPATLLAAHLDPPVDPGVARVHPEARIEASASVDDRSWVGPGASVPAQAVVERCLVLPGASVPPGHHRRAIILGEGTVLAPGA